jgi:broad specificity phosphatase PhoE
MRAIEEAFLWGVEGVTEVWLVRHGDCYEGLTEAADPPLSEVGREQARRLAARLARLEITAVYSSPLLRARQTAAAFSDSVRLDPRLREIANEPAPAGAGTTVNAHVHFSEPHAEVLERLRGAIDEAIVAEGPGRIVVVTHAGAILAYLCHVLRIESGKLRLLPYFTSVSVVRARGERRMAGALADTSHLDS